MPDFPKTEQEGHDHDLCPSCRAELCGGLIRDTITHPEDRRFTEEDIVSFYGTKRCYSKTIGIEIQGVYDGVCFWFCQVCGHREHRFDGPGRIYDAVEIYWAAQDADAARA